MVVFIAGIPPISVHCVTSSMPVGLVRSELLRVGLQRMQVDGVVERKVLLFYIRVAMWVSRLITIDSCFEFACVDSPFVQQVNIFHKMLHHHRSRSQLAVGRSGGSQCCSGRVDELALEQAAGGLVKQDVGVVIEPGEKLVHQVSSFVLGSTREPELGRMSVDDASCRGIQARECSPRRWRWATLRAPYVWPGLQARRC